MSSLVFGQGDNIEAVPSINDEVLVLHCNCAFQVSLIRRLCI